MKTSKLEKFAVKNEQVLTRDEMKHMLGGFPVTCHCEDGSVRQGEAPTVKDATDMCNTICG